MTSSPNSTVLVQPPSEALRPFIRRFTVVEFGTACRDYHLPETGLVAAFRYRGDLSLDGFGQAPRAVLTGILDTLRSHDHGRESGILVAAFTPLGAAAFFRESLSEFSDRSTDLADILPVAELPEQLSEALDHESRVQIAEQFLLGAIRDPAPDPTVAAAVHRIQAQAAVRIPELADRLGLSQSALERRFKRNVGTSPKRFASLVRLQQVVRLRAAGGDWSAIAHAAGYFDQSHFIKDFRRIAGQTPAAYFGQF